MTWQSLRGHDDVVARFRTAIGRNRLASTFLFVGLPGIGKRMFAVRMAQALLCDRVPEAEFAPCGRCSTCVQVEAGTHPDVQIVSRPPDKSTLPLEIFIGDDEHRNREGLCYNLTLKPFSGRRRIAIIDDADYLNKEGANCLLKTLEEPPPKSVLILIGTSEQRQLPTIRSRCQIVRFTPLSKEDLTAVLLERQLVDDAAEAERAARLGRGSVETALRRIDPALWDFRGLLLEQLAKDELDPLRVAKMTAEFVEQAGKEATVKRRRLMEVFAIAEDFYGLVLRGAAGPTTDIDPALQAAADTVLRRRTIQEESAAAALERTIIARGHVEANASPVNIIDAWMDDVSAAMTVGAFRPWD